MRGHIGFLVAVSLLAASGCRGRCDDCGGPMTAPPTTTPPATPVASEGPGLLQDIDVDVLLDIDQPREQKPGGSWTEQQYIGPKQYDRLFVEITHDEPANEGDDLHGPLGTVDRVDLYLDTSTTPVASFARTGALTFTYHAETVDGFEDDGRGPTSDTREKLKLFLGHDVGAYIRDTHPFTVVLRARTKDGALVYKKVLSGDEAGDYPTIVPPRPY